MLKSSFEPPAWLADKYSVFFGNPHQVVVNDTDRLVKMVALNYGDKPCFISHNGYYPWKERPSFVYFSKVFNDLDDEQAPYITHIDAQKLVKWYLTNKLPHKVDFSGAKGFHVFELVKGQWLKMNASLRYSLRSYQLKVMNINEVEHLCESCAGDYRRLCRIPNTPHNKSKNFCVELTDEQVLDWSFSDIVKYSKQPHPLLSLSDTDEFSTLTERIKDIGIDNDYLFTTTHEGTLKDGVICTDAYLKALFECYPCILSDLTSHNPAHFGRFAGVVYLKGLSFSFEEVLKFFQDMAERFNWVDRGNKHEMVYQVRDVYMHRNDSMPTCSRIKQKNLCIGKYCKRYVEGLR